MVYREGDIVVFAKHSIAELNGIMGIVKAVDLCGISSAKVDVGTTFPIYAYFDSIRKASNAEALAFSLGIRNVQR